MKTFLLLLLLVAALPATTSAQYIGGNGDGHSSASRGPAHFTYSGTLRLSGTDGTLNDEGWRMLSLPVGGLTRGDLADDLNLSAETGNSIYTFDGANFTALASDSDPFTLGRGFLLYLFDDATEPITSTGATLDVPGNPLASPVNVSGLAVDQQWHLLGNPFDLPFDLSTLGLAAGGFQETVQIWDPRAESWTPVSVGSGIVDDLAAFQGFFVERTTLGSGQTSLTFPNSGRRVFGLPLVGGKGNDDSFQLRLELESTGEVTSRDSGARIHFSSSAQATWDPLDATRLAPPRSEHFAILAFQGSRSGAQVDQVQMSYPTSWDGQAVFPLAIRSRGAFEQHRLSWPDLSGVPEDWTLELFEAATGKVIDMRTTDEYWLSQSVAESSLSLVVSPSGTHEVGVPGGGLLAQSAYPNPFSTSSQMDLVVVIPQRARISVYDVLGRRVALLHDGPLGAGHHNLTLDGSGLASGPYLLLLETEHSRRSQMIFRQ